MQLRKLLHSKMCSHVSLGGLFQVKNGLLQPIEELTEMLTDTVQSAEATGAKMLVSIGGKNGSIIHSKDLSLMASTESTRSNFATQVENFVNQQNFDGIVINWLYPGCRASTCSSIHDSDKPNFIKLLHALKDKLGEEKIIVVSLPAFVDFFNGFELSKMTALVDYFQVLSFGYVDQGARMTGHNAPLPNMNKSMEQLLMLVKEPGKLLLGVSARVEVYKLTDKRDTKVGAKKEVNKGFATSYDQVCKRLSAVNATLGTSPTADDNICLVPHEEASMDNKKICSKVQNAKSVVVKRGDPLQGNFLAVDDFWFSFEDKLTLSKKIELLNRLDVAGLYVDSVFFSDTENACGCGDFSFLRILAELLSGGNGCELPICI